MPPPMSDDPNPHEHAPHDGEAHDHPHDHEHGQGLLARLAERLPFSHSHGETAVDAALEGSERGIWALKVSLIGLGATAALQVIIVLASGSVGLLADTVHNVADALTAVPLWIAFTLGRRPPNRRYTYGYGRAEDLAGVAIVAVIFISAGVAAYESWQRLLAPVPLRHLSWVMLASVVGFLGNEAVALLRIRVGRQIGSAALVTDGLHARVDGLTSLAVLAGAVGVWAGFPIADPLVGILITLAILMIGKDAARTMWHRMMDAVDPDLVERVERLAGGVSGVEDVHAVRVRWLGRRLQAEMHVTVNEDLPTRESHGIAEEVRHSLLHGVPGLAAAHVHVDPCGHSGADAHAGTAHHELGAA